MDITPNNSRDRRLSPTSENFRRLTALIPSMNPSSAEDLVGNGEGEQMGVLPDEMSAAEPDGGLEAEDADWDGHSSDMDDSDFEGSDATGENDTDVPWSVIFATGEPFTRVSIVLRRGQLVTVQTTERWLIEPGIPMNMHHTKQTSMRSAPVTIPGAFIPGTWIIDPSLPGTITFDETTVARTDTQWHVLQTSDSPTRMVTAFTLKHPTYTYTRFWTTSTEATDTQTTDNR